MAVVILNPRAGYGLPELADSKALTPAAREQAYAGGDPHALAWHGW